MDLTIKMTFKFKPTVLSFVILAGLCFWCGLHIAFNSLVPAFGMAAAFAFIAYHVGKVSVLREVEDQAQYNEIATQAEQIDEISLMPSITLFPEIQFQLSGMAASKYEEIGNLERAQQLKASMENMLL